MSERKAYLGDGVYVDCGPGALVLTTENGIETTNQIVIDDEVYAKLVRYVERLRIERRGEAFGLKPPPEPPVPEPQT